MKASSLLKCYPNKNEVQDDREYKSATFSFYGSIIQVENILPPPLTPILYMYIYFKKTSQYTYNIYKPIFMHAILSAPFHSLVLQDKNGAQQHFNKIYEKGYFISKFSHCCSYSQFYGEKMSFTAITLGY